jgi:hypothetical protein
MFKKFSEIGKMVLLLVAYIIIVLLPFVLLALFYTDKVLMLWFGVFTAIYLILNLFSIKRPRVFGLTPDTIDMLGMGLITAIVTHLNCTLIISVMVGVALADWILSSIAITLCHFASFIITDDLFSVDEAVRIDRNNVLFKAIKYIKPEIYYGLINDIYKGN